MRSVLILYVRHIDHTLLRITGDIQSPYLGTPAYTIYSIELH